MGGTAIRHSTRCAGRRGRATAGTTRAVPDGSTTHSSADRIVVNSYNLRHCPRDAKTTAYFSLVRSTTDYCSAIWDPYLEKDKTKLERVNRRAARIICNKTDPRDHTSVTNLLRDDFGWPNLEHRKRHLRLTLMYKICHQQIAVPPTQLLPPPQPPYTLQPPV